MAQANDKVALLYQNLCDAGCDKELTEKCMKALEGGNAQDMIPVLTEYRAHLRSTVRTGQKQIDALDFLIYRLQKQNI